MRKGKIVVELREIEMEGSNDHSYKDSHQGETGAVQVQENI
jgi:hypothetical protein